MVSKIDNEIGRQIRERRLREGWSLQYLAAVADLTVTSLDAIELGQRRAPMTALAKICAALGIPMADLFRLFIDQAEGAAALPAEDAAVIKFPKARLH